MITSKSSMNFNGKQINHILNFKCYEEAMNKTQQIPRVAWQVEIPGLPNNKTGNLKQKQIIS